MTAYELRDLLENAIKVMDEFYMIYDEAGQYAGKIHFNQLPVALELNEFREYHLWYDGDEYSLAEVTTWKDLAEVLKTIGVLDEEDVALAEAVNL